MLYWQFNFHLACVVAFLSLIPFPFSRVHAMIRRFQSYTQLMHFGLNFISFHFLRLQIKIYEQRAALCMCSAQCHQNVYIDCSYGLQLLFALPLSFSIILLVECTHRCNTIVLVHRFSSFICIANTLIHALFALSTCLPCFASTAEKKNVIFIYGIHFAIAIPILSVPPHVRMYSFQKFYYCSLHLSFFFPFLLLLQILPSLSHVCSMCVYEPCAFYSHFFPLSLALHLLLLLGCCCSDSLLFCCQHSVDEIITIKTK